MSDVQDDEIVIDEDAERESDSTGKHVTFDIATYPSDLTLGVYPLRAS
ncbi:MAG: hypothetical protein R8L07_15050 [Alphaproteobacteria bacterium]|nr:hypothetical protein [Alphaproteobacteria bacterium]